MPLLEATFRQSFSTLLEARDDISLHTRLEAKASLTSPLEAKGDLLSALLTGTGSASPCPLDLSEVMTSMRRSSQRCWMVFDPNGRGSRSKPLPRGSAASRRT